MDYCFANDLKAIRGILNLTQEDLAEQLGVEQVTLSRSESGMTVPSEKLLEKLYSYAFERDVKINSLKELLWKDNIGNREKLLFHGAKSEIKGKIEVGIGRANNDFGRGFYAGESYAQAISFVSGFEKSSVYFMKFDDRDLKCKRYSVDQDWMMTISYYRGALEEYADNSEVLSLIEKSRDCDYIIAPIADNRMFQIINSFISGEITDEQCRHCLAATNLGMQYVFISDKAADHIELVERCYISENEKEYYRNIRSSDSKLGEDKVKLAKIQYRGKGKYIDEIFN